MIGSLKGLPGKAKAIYDYLTTYLSSTRCAKIDNLDVAISTRAAASTALSTATWTAARAGYLDFLNGGIIQSIQTGYLNNTAVYSGVVNTEDAYYLDQTINSVNTAKCFVIVDGWCEFSGAPSDRSPLTGRLTSGTNVRLCYRASGTGTWLIRGRYYVVEFK